MLSMKCLKGWYIIWILFMLCFVSCTTAPKSKFLSVVQIDKKYASGNKMVMVTHPFCGFSRKAFQDFSAITRQFLSTNGVIIAPINKKYEGEELQAVNDWNQKNPDFIHLPVYNDSRLRAIELNSTPQFYFFKDGELIGKIRGWPKDGSNAPKIKKYILGLEAKR